jgi:tetratricopeptide (TPR) repeat protein
MRKLFTVIAVPLCLSLSLPPARAAPPSDAAITQARAHYRAGEAAFAAGDYPRAAEEYQAAYALAPLPALLFNLGSAYRRQAHVTHGVDDARAALRYYRAYLEADPTGAGSADARRFVAGLERELAAQPTAPTTPPAEPSQAAPPPVAVPAPAPLELDATEAPPEPPAAVARDDERNRDGRGLRIAGLVTAGAGVALIATGAVFAVQAHQAYGELAALPSGATWDQTKHDSADASRDRAYLCVGVGAAAIATGAVLTFVLGRTAAVQPAVGPSAVGLSLAGRFE